MEYSQTGGSYFELKLLNLITGELKTVVDREYRSGTNYQDVVYMQNYQDGLYALVFELYDNWQSESFIKY